MTAFINNISINSSMIYLDTQERQLGKGQDIAISGRNLLNKNGKLCDWTLVADGHGGFLAINIIKKLIADDKLAEIIIEEEPMDALVAYMKTRFIGSNSGTTCIIVKIFEDNLIQSWNVGDSQVAIYVNKQLHYISCPHNMKNPLEQVRLKEQIEYNRVHIEKMKDYVPVIATKTTMHARVGEYIYFGNTKIAMTQALGDGWLTGIAPEKFEYTFDPADEVRIIAGTDGYWEQYIFDGPDALEDLTDNTTLPADQLIDKMEQRWKKEDWQYFWNPKDASKSILVGYEGAYDDIGLAIWSNRMPSDPINNLNMLAIVEEEEEVKEVKEEIIKKSNLDADQQAALDLWQKLNLVKVESLWTGDGKDPEFDALADKIFEDFANGSNKEDSESDPDMPGLILYYPQIYVETIQDKKNKIIRLEQELAEDIIIDNTSIENDGQIIDIESLRLSQMESLKLVIKEHIQMLQITEIRERLRYLFNGNEFYKLVKELNLYEQELLMQCDEDFIKEHEERV